MYNIYSQVRKPPLNAPVHHIGPFPCAPKKHPKGSWVPNGFRLPNIQNEPSEETGQLPMPKGNWDNGGTCQYSPVSSKYGWNPPFSHSTPHLVRGFPTSTGVPLANGCFSTQFSTIYAAPVARMSEDRLKSRKT